MSEKITFMGNPMTLAGRRLKTGAPAPDFKATTQDMKSVSLEDFKDRIKIISSFPSLDTPVCDLQVKEFNKRAASFSQDVAVIGISKDLPFAQKRFCHENDITKETVVSDYKTSSFGLNYGLLIRELNLLARAVMILDKNNTVRYLQVVPELTKAPDYEDVIRNLQEIIKVPALSSRAAALPVKCKPCEVGTPAIPANRAEDMISGFKAWELVEGKKLVKEFKFKDFVEAKYFLDIISIIAEEQAHHPTMTIIYNKLKVTLTTHAAGGLTENDFIMAKIIDEIGG